MEPTETNAFRLVHGASDGWPGWYVDRLGDWLLSQSESALTRGQWDLVERMEDVRGIYHLSLPRQSGRTGQAKLAPQLVRGQTAPDQIIVRENGTQFELRLHEGCSVGLFLDQRDNRRRFLVNHVAAGFPLFDGAAAGREVLNTFAYTCGFSVCAARAGARTTNVDLSRKYLEWGNRNFALNDLDPAEHDFLCGDVFDWLRRLNKRQRRFDGIVLDPPTFSRSKEQGLFRAEKDYARLLLAALPLLKPRGVALASMNAAAVRPESFLKTIEAAVTSARRRLLELHYVPQPPDFPITREEPAYLKTAWLRIG
jgi:23S rRNA (cytosine1962-C5)-methyltransferase